MKKKPEKEEKNLPVGAENPSKGKGKEAGKEAGVKKEKKAPKAPKAPAAPALDMDQPLFSRLDLRVGKIIACEPHPDAERLYVEKIDVGEAEPRTIISGLRAHYTLEEMVGRKIVTICNLKPRPMRGITSHGMVLCAKEPDGEKVEFAKVPEDAQPGDSILVEGESFKQPWEGKQVDKHGVWMAAAEKMKSNKEGVCCFDGKALVTGGKKLTTQFKEAVLS